MNQSAPNRSWLLVAAAIFAVGWGGNEFTPMLVFYRHDHGLSEPTVYLLLFAYVIGIFPAQLIGGPASDRYGRKPFMLAAPILALAGSLILGFGVDSVSLLLLGRVLSGVAVGLALAVGSSWLKELSSHPAAGARRSSITATAGFGLGAACAGILVTWAPAPQLLTYVVNAVLCAVSFGLLLRAPETRHGGVMRAPTVNGRVALLCIALAPWVFGCCAVAYAVIPALLAKQAGEYTVLYSAGTCLAGLGVAVLTQLGLARYVVAHTGRSIRLSLIIVMVGMALAVLADEFPSLVLGLVAAAVLGAGYGLALVAGLTHIQLSATDDELAGHTALYASMTYTGFAAPMVMALIVENSPITYAELLGVGVAMAAVSLAVLLPLTGKHHEPRAGSHGSGAAAGRTVAPSEA